MRPTGSAFDNQVLERPAGGVTSATASFATASVSSKGGREVNEDCFGSSQQHSIGCWVVADGLGGYRGGEAASHAAVEAALASFELCPDLSVAALRSHVEAAHQALLKLQDQEPSLSTMRTTIVVMLSNSRRALWAHVGDSRLYGFEGERVVCRTEDHSVPQALVRAGELSSDRIRHHADRNRLLQSLGNPEKVARPTIGQRSLTSDSAFLLCSDGFWEYVTESEMEVDLAKARNAQDWLARMEARLLERAPEGNDNYTAVAVCPDPAMWRPSRLRSTNTTQPNRVRRSRRLSALSAIGTCLVLAGLGLLIWQRTRPSSAGPSSVATAVAQPSTHSAPSKRDRTLENAQPTKPKKAQALSVAKIDHPAPAANRPQTNVAQTVPPAARKVQEMPQVNLAHPGWVNALATSLPSGPATNQPVPPKPKPAAETGPRKSVEIRKPARVPSHIEEAKCIDCPAPSYPQMAKDHQIQGRVELTVKISEAGTVTEVTRKSGNRILAKAARAAVSQWKFKPELLNGKPIEVQREVSIDF